MDNNKNSHMSDPDEDPTVELERLSEAACAEFMHSCDSTGRSDSLSGSDGTQQNGIEFETEKSVENAAVIQELRDELKFRDEMNHVLRLGIEQQQEKCRSLEEQVDSLQEMNEELRHELERSRHLATESEQKLETSRDSEKALLDNLSEFGNADATNAELLDQLKSSNAKIDHYKNQIAALRRKSLTSARTSTGRAPGALHMPDSQEEDCWILVGLDSNESDTYTLGDGIVTVGSSADNNIQIQSQFISQHHAQLVKTDKGCVLGDLSSTNGTFINSRRINKRILRAGDIVTFGKHRFRYEKRSAESITSDMSPCGHSLN